ncbi:hypothetical protein SK128_022522, partial [Halocaridina rubra]
SPSSISVIGGGEGSTVKAVVNQTLQLVCVVKEARPPPSVAWYRNGIMLDQGLHSERIELSSAPRRWSVRSRLSIIPTSEDDGQQYSCRALHPSLMSSPTTLVASVTLNILHPPDPPVISGYSAGETLKEGQHRTLICHSRGGNPRPKLTWYRNGKLLKYQNITYIKPSNEHEAMKVILQIIVTAEDDRAVYECRADNEVLRQPFSTNVTLTVH